MTSSLTVNQQTLTHRKTQTRSPNLLLIVLSSPTPLSATLPAVAQCPFYSTPKVLAKRPVQARRNRRATGSITRPSNGRHNRPESLLQTQQVKLTLLAVSKQRTQWRKPLSENRPTGSIKGAGGSDRKYAWPTVSGHDTVQHATLRSSMAFIVARM